MQIEKQRTRISSPERLFYLAAGTTAIWWGLKRRSWFGAALALAGAQTMMRGLSGLHNEAGTRGLPYGRGMKIRRSVTIARSPEDLYHFWRNFGNLPRFMRHLESVRIIDPLHSHWSAKAPAGRSLEWDAEIIADRTGELIGWRSLGTVDHAGSVRFERAPGDRGSVVRIQLQYNPPGGHLAALLARAFGENPDQQVREDLHRFKALMEAGEVVTVEGQPSGRAEDIRRSIFAGHAASGGPVDLASEASFPASDAPPWTGGAAG